MQSADEQQQVEARIRELLARCGAEPARVAVTIEAGAPEEQIPLVAARYQATSVILGRRHRSTIDRIYVGSTTSAIISLMQVPVLVIPLHGES